MSTVVYLLLIAVACFAAYQFAESRHWKRVAAELEKQNNQQRADLESANEAARDLQVAELQVRLLTESKQQLEEKFRLLASDALENNSQLFLDRSRAQMQHLIEPVSQSLRKFEEQIQAIEKARSGAYEGLVAQVNALTQLQERVRQSTEELKTALRSPIQRGRWGEIQLRRVVEMAGMLAYCDFAEQKTLFGETNARPDLIVRLPNECQVVVDAKVSLEAYLRAVEAETDTDRNRFMAEHARQVRTHVKGLADKSYWERLPCTPQFVVAFLPLESLYSAALEHDPDLLNFAVSQRVLLASPMNLISLLLTVAHGWQQKALAENVERIRETGMELYNRLGIMHGHFAKLGEAIERTVATYNQTVGSLERNVLSSARKFKDLKPASADPIPESSEIESSPRSLDSSKWRLLEPVEPNQRAG